jgi:hypothetical protein
MWPHGAARRERNGLSLRDALSGWAAQLCNNIGLTALFLALLAAGESAMKC